MHAAARNGEDRVEIFSQIEHKKIAPVALGPHTDCWVGFLQ